MHTVRTQADHCRDLVPLVSDRCTVRALDLPGVGHSEIVPVAAYNEPAMRAGVSRLLGGLDLTDVTLVGESMGATPALTVAADHSDRVRRAVAVNPYDFPGSIARAIVSAVRASGIGPVGPGAEPRPVVRAVLRGGLVRKDALREEYLEELLAVGRRPGYPVVAQAVYRNLDSSVAPRRRYVDVTVPVHLVYGDRDANGRALPGATHVELGDTGHFVALERPGVLADLLV